MYKLGDNFNGFISSQYYTKPLFKKYIEAKTPSERASTKVIFIGLLLNVQKF